MHLTATLIAKPEYHALLREALVALAEHTRRDPNNQRYVVLQSLDNPHQMVVQEQYTDAGALSAHMADPQVAAVLDRFPDWLACPPLIVRAQALR